MRLGARKDMTHGTDLADILKRKEKTGDHVTRLFKYDNRAVFYMGSYYGSIDV